MAEQGVAIGVIAVPAGAAQAMCDRLVAAGVTSILNFAPLVLSVPDGVDVRKVDLSIELQILAFHAQRRNAERFGQAAIRQQRKRRRCKSERSRRRPEPQERAGLSRLSGPRSAATRSASCCTTSPALPDIAETFVISTCNRVEVYAEVDRFHGGVAGVCELLSRYSGIPPHELTSSLYVHYEDRAVQHLLAVSSGLDSMVVGEDQILGQVRSALKLAGEHGHARPVAARPRQARAAHRQAGPRGDGHRPARPQPGQRRPELAASRLGPTEQACSRPRRSRRRGGRDERARRGHRRAGRRGAGHCGEPDAGEGGTACGRRGRRRGRGLRRPAGRDRGGRPGDLLHRRRRGW